MHSGIKKDKEMSNEVKIYLEQDVVETEDHDRVFAAGIAPFSAGTDSFNCIFYTEWESRVIEKFRRKIITCFRADRTDLVKYQV